VNTATWLTVLGGVVGIAIVWGGLKNEVGNLKALVMELRTEMKASSRDQGRRIGDLETAAEVAKSVQRALTGAVPITESGRDRDERDRYNLPEGGT
jgi:hypothetical protein